MSQTLGLQELSISKSYHTVSVIDLEAVDIEMADVISSTIIT